MTHSDRYQYLRSIGWTIDVGCKLPDIGQVLWIEKDKLTAWLSSDGVVRLHGVSESAGGDMTWSEFLEYLNPTPVVAPHGKQQKGLFSNDD